MKPTEKNLMKILAKDYILLPTKNKEPLVKNWNKYDLDYYKEKRTIEQLLTLNGEYSLRTGKLLMGGYYFIVIDLDIIWNQKTIGNFRYVETPKGIHRYLLVKELPKSCFLVNKDGDKIGDLLSVGKYVVGMGSKHKSGVYSLRGRNGIKLFFQIENLKELQEFLKVRNIFTTPWGKTGIENIHDLELFQEKPKKTYQEKKVRLEKEVKNSKKPLHICYICLASFKKDQKIIKDHLQSDQHLKELKAYRNRRSNTIKTKQNTIYGKTTSKIE